MPESTKKKASKKRTISLQIGNKEITVEPMPVNEVAKANARIQKKVQPIFRQIRKTRRAAAITASKIILNA